MFSITTYAPSYESALRVDESNKDNFDNLCRKYNIWNNYK